MGSQEKKGQKENPLLNILINIVIPSVTLSKFSTDEYLGSEMGLIVALSLPVLYGIYDFIKQKKVNFISVLGFVSILLTGVIGLFELDKDWIAWKEAAVPFIIGVAVAVSIKTPYPLVEKLLFNDKIVDIKKINLRLEHKGNAHIFKKKLDMASFLLAGSFFLSAVLNFALAKFLIVSESGTEEFTQQLGKMTALSFPVIAVPSTIFMLVALWYLLNSVKKCTGLEISEVLNGME